MSKTLKAEMQNKAKQSLDQSPRILKRDLNIEFDEKNEAQKINAAKNIADNSYQQILNAIKTEVENNPNYEGKTHQEIADMLNTPVEVENEEQVIESARLATILRAVVSDAETAEGFVVDSEGKISIDSKELQEKIDIAIEYERVVDPEKIGYKDKTKEEALNMMKQARIITKKTKSIQPARVNEILKGVSFAPNVITVEIVKEALNAQ